MQKVSRWPPPLILRYTKKKTKINQYHEPQTKIIFSKKFREFLFSCERFICSISHGDMIYLVAERENLFPNQTSSSPMTTVDSLFDKTANGNSYSSPKIGSVQLNSSIKTASNSDLKEDEVDVQLDKIDGRIPRPRDSHL